MIQHRAEALITLIEQQRVRNQHVDQLEGFSTQAQEIERAVTNVAPTLTAWQLFQTRAIGNVEAPESVSGLLQQLRQIRDRYVEDPGTILGANRLPAVRNGVPVLGAKLRQELLTAWRAYGATKVPAVNADVLNVLGHIAALTIKVKQVGAGIRDLDDRLNRLPSSDTDIEEFEAAAEAVRIRWNDFDSDHLPAEVLRFLREASDTGAALDDLTDTVKKWLDQYGLGASFRIRAISNSPGRP